MNRKMARLGLGTVQFGLDYGISNRKGRTTLNEVCGILAIAAENGVRVLDTATTYGESEAILGTVGVADRGFDIVTKTPVFVGERIEADQVTNLTLALLNSRRLMGVERVAALLVHHPDDLLKPGGERLFAAMEEARDKGFVGRIGASIYTEAQIEALLERYPLQILQLPINVFDQRLLESGMLARINRLGIEVHARSVFLQGLLLMDPDHLGPHFGTLRDHLGAFRRACVKSGSSVSQVALGFVRSLPEVDVALVGVNEQSQLRELLAAADLPTDPFEWAQYAWTDSAVLNPSNWPN
jgi:aryl-alcohol dehydrogenase-like predicted oxidoreductase